MSTEKIDPEKKISPETPEKQERSKEREKQLIVASILELQENNQRANQKDLAKLRTIISTLKLDIASIEPTEELTAVQIDDLLLSTKRSLENIKGSSVEDVYSHMMMARLEIGKVISWQEKAKKRYERLDDDILTTIKQLNDLKDNLSAEEKENFITRWWRNDVHTSLADQIKQAERKRIELKDAWKLEKLIEKQHETQKREIFEQIADLEFEAIGSAAREIRERNIKLREQLTSPEIKAQFNDQLIEDNLKPAIEQLIESGVISETATTSYLPLVKKYFASYKEPEPGVYETKESNSQFWTLHELVTEHPLYKYPEIYEIIYTGQRNRYPDRTYNTMIDILLREKNEKELKTLKETVLSDSEDPEYKQKTEYSINYQSPEEREYIGVNSLRFLIEENDFNSIIVEREWATRWETLKKYLIESEIVADESFEEVEDRQINYLFDEYIDNSDSSRDRAQESAREMAVFNNPKAIPLFLQTIESTESLHHAENTMGIEMVNILRNSDPNKLAEVLSSLSKEQQDVLKIITNENSYLSKRAKHDTSIWMSRYIKDGKETVQKENEIQQLIEAGWSKQEIDDHFIDRGTMEEILERLLKVTEITGQSKKERILERFELFVRWVNPKDPDSLNIIDRLAEELEMDKEDVYLKCLSKISSPPGNQAIQELASPEGKNTFSFPEKVIDNNFNLSEDERNKISNLYQSESLQKNASIREEYLSGLIDLANTDSEEVLKIILSTVEGVESEIEPLRKILVLFSFISKIDEQGVPRIKNIKITDFIKVGDNLQEIFNQIKTAFDESIKDKTKAFLNRTADPIEMVDFILLVSETTDNPKEEILLRHFESLTRNLVVNKPDSFVIIDRLMDELGLSEKDIYKKIVDRGPQQFTRIADRKTWKLVFGEDRIKSLLNVLPKKSDEKRNAFTHNGYDRTTKFMEFLFTRIHDVELNEETFDIITQFVETFGLSKTTLLFEYFRNIILKETNGTELPQDQIDAGITSIKELERRFTEIQKLLFSNESMTDIKFKELSAFEREILSRSTGKSTHRFDGGRPSMDTIVEDWERNYANGEIAPMPEEYQPSEILVPRIVIEVNVEAIQESYDTIHSELKIAMENPKDLSGVKAKAGEVLTTKISELQAILDKKPGNRFIQAELDKYSNISSKLETASDLDSILETIVTVDRKFAGKTELASVMRELLFRKLFEINFSPEMVRDLARSIEGGVSGQGVLNIINIVDNFIKHHVLNAERGNADSYWRKETWQAIREAKGNSKQVDVSKLFKTHLDKLRKEVDKFVITEVKKPLKVQMIPDRGFVGEMSGYIADVCYTAVYPLLVRYPNVIPYKFVAKNESTLENEFIGSVLVFELEDSDGEKVMMVRGFDVPDEKDLDIGVFIEKFLDDLEVVAKQKGFTKILIPGITGAISNYGMTLSYMKRKFIVEKNKVSLSETFAFNGSAYDLTDNCYVARIVTLEDSE